MSFTCPLESTFIPVEISGDRNHVVVKINGFLCSTEFYSLLNFLRSRGYTFNRVNRAWFKKCNTSRSLEEEMNELENFLIEEGIDFVNLHPLYRSLVSGSSDR